MMIIWTVSRLTWVTVPAGGNGSSRQPMSSRRSTSGGLARMRNARLPRWGGGADLSKDSRSWVASLGDRTAAPRRKRTWLEIAIH